MKEVTINYKGLEIISYEKFINTSDADRIFSSALSEIPWETSTIKMYGKEVPIPRLNVGLVILDVSMPIQAKACKDMIFLNP